MKSNLHPADTLGNLKAQIAALEIAAEVERQRLIAMGEGAHEGVLFRATVSFADRNVTKWKAVAEHFNPSRQLIKAHTETTEDVATVKVVARNGSNLAA